VWQSSLTVDELRRLEKTSSYDNLGANDYEIYCSLHKLEQVYARLDILIQNFYTKILQQSDCLHKLLPLRDLEYVQKLRTFKNFDLFCRTSHFQNSFLPRALRNY